MVIILPNITKTKRPMLFYKGIHMETLKWLPQNDRKVSESSSSKNKTFYEVFKRNQTFGDSNFALNFPRKVLKKEIWAD